MPDATPLPGSTLHALCVYAEPLVAGRRVVVFGDATLGLGERLLALGARLVHAYDPQAARVAAASERAARGLTILALPAGEFDVREGAFDLAVIVDVAEFPQPRALLARVRRLLAPGGAALVRARAVDADGRGRPRQGAVDYYELYDLVAMQFAQVRMVGQVRWAGVALAELGRGEGEPDVTVDTQLVDGDEGAEAFIAVGSQDDVRLAEYALVQVPTAPATDPEAAAVLDTDRADLAAAQLRASLLEAQLEELRTRRNVDGATAADALAAAEAEAADLAAERERALAHARDAAARAEEATALLRGRDDDLARLHDRAAMALKELEEERRQRSRLEVELVAARGKLEALVHDAKALVTTAARAPALEVAVAQLEAGTVQLAERLARTEEARAQAEARLAAALREAEILRSSRADAFPEEKDQEADGRVALVAARVAELEAEVAALEAEAAVLSDGHGSELSALEAALRDRAKLVHAMEAELARRERIILDLVHAVDEARAMEGAPPVGVAGDDSRTRAALADAETALREARHRAERARAENVELREKLDAAALEIARREADSATSAWRIQELEQAIGRLEDEQSELTMTIPPPAFQKVERQANDATLLAQRLAAAEDEVDLLRQALAQEHEARVRAESGEALTQARAELARQAAVLESLSRELEAHDGARAAIPAGDPA